MVAAQPSALSRRKVAEANLQGSKSTQAESTPALPLRSRVRNTSKGNQHAAKSRQEDCTQKSDDNGRPDGSNSITERERGSTSREPPVPTGQASEAVQGQVHHNSTTSGDDVAEADEEQGGDKSKESQFEGAQKTGAVVGGSRHGQDSILGVEQESALSAPGPTSRKSGGVQGQLASSAKAAHHSSEAESDEETEASFVEGIFERNNIILDVLDTTFVVPSWVPSESANFDFDRAPRFKSAVLEMTVPQLTLTEESRVKNGPVVQGLAIEGDDVWLDDEVVNSYLQLLRERDDVLCRRDPTRKSAFFFDSHFMTKLLNIQPDGSIEGYNYDEEAKRDARLLAAALRDVNNTLRMIFFPIHIVDQWFMGVANLDLNRIAVFDSKGDDEEGKNGPMYTNYLFRFLQDFYKDNELSFPDRKSWRLSTASPIVKQRHGACVRYRLVLSVPSYLLRDASYLILSQTAIAASSCACMRIS